MLEAIDLDVKLTRDEYVEQRTEYQVRLMHLATEVYFQQRPVVLVFEGVDAGGKGGAIKRVTERLDPRGYVVYPIAAPKGDDAAHHYLWRFWRRLPERGQIAIFDRTWYGRVLVERLEGFATEDEWKRAYQEINQFERELVDFSTIVLKFWMHIGKDEQLARFEARRNTPYKSWKLTDEDWRNREKWDHYIEAVEDMLRRTSTTYAPWTIVEGNDKYYSRVKVLKTIVAALEAELDLPEDFYAGVALPHKLVKTKAAPPEKKKGKKKKQSKKKAKK
jgi:polyphosphate kinase 2 (PPK2 family)